MTRLLLDDTFGEALAYALELHRDQWRKGNAQLPYLGHLLGVCSLVLDDSGTQEQAIAALLHDAVEVRGGRPTLAEIDRRFGSEAAGIVEACSDTLDKEHEQRPWRARREDYLAHLERQPPGVLRVSLADKLFNARSILRDLLEIGDELWERFNAGRDEQLWHYRALADAFLRLAPGPMARELDEVVSSIERHVAR